MFLILKNIVQIQNEFHLRIFKMVSSYKIKAHAKSQQTQKKTAMETYIY